MRRPLLAALTGLAVAVTTVLGTAGGATAAGTTAAPGTAASGTTAARPAEGIAARSGLPTPAGKVAPDLVGAEGTVTAFVELAAPSGVEVSRTGAESDVVGDAEDRIEAIAEAVVPDEVSAQSGTDGVQRVAVTSDLVAGTVVRGDAEEIRALAESPDVVSVRRMTAKRPANKGADAFTRALEAWQATGETGEGIRVGVVDTGIDYTHANFGGPGTVEAYRQAYGQDGTAPVRRGLYDPDKYLGGHDFAGPRYDGDGVVEGSHWKPVPDANPIDATRRTAANGGHGSHVAGTGFGYGVGPDGTTFRGDYDDVTDVSDWRIGPGTAPGAGVYALKIFGDGGGASYLAMEAMEWAADPNGDHDYSDHLDVLNLSFGAEATPADDPENLFVDELAELGVLSVFSTGNAGDRTDVGGTPGSARSGLTVATSFAAAMTFDAVEVLDIPDPQLRGLHAAQNSVRYERAEDVTAPVSFVGADVTGCTDLTGFADRIAGTIVYLWWDDAAPTALCGTEQRWDNAEAAGAVGVLLGTGRPDFPLVIGGNARIPGAQLTAAATEALLPAITAGTATIRIGPGLADATFATTPELGDTLSSGSSRGVHGSLGVIKPDVAAPGQQISSTASGTGTGARTLSGSSMAAAHVAGIAALVRATHPDWTPAQVKASIMNTATHDVTAGPAGTGPVYGPLRVGSGRVDTLDAVRTTTIAHDTADPALVSVSFGVVPVGERTEVRQRTVTVENTGNRTVRYATSFVAATTTGGATITTSPATVVVPPGSSRTVTLTLRADPATLTRDLDPTSVAGYDLGVPIPREHVASLSGRLVLTSGRTQLRVPVLAAPRLVSDLTARPVAFDEPGSSSAPLTLEGRGLDGGAGWRSIVVPMQLVATSPRLELPEDDDGVADDDAGQGGARATPSPSPAPSPAEPGEPGEAGEAEEPLSWSEAAVRSGDVRAVGFASTAPQRVAASDDPREGLIGLGIVTDGEWANLGTGTFLVVDIDVESDGTPDFQTVVSKLDTDGDGAADVDVTVAETYDADGAIVGQEPVNTVFGDVDTTVFDNNVVVVPISLSDLGIRPGQVPTFRVWSGSEFAPDPSGVVDEVEPFAADPYAPEYWFDAGVEDALLFAADPGTAVTVHRTADPGDEPSPLLVLHTHNATPASRAQVVDVTAPVARPTTTTLAVSGGLAVGTDAVLTATVDPRDATGSVVFRDGGTELATVRVVDGAATTTVALGAGPHRLTASFEPAAALWLTSSSDAVPVDVARATAAVTLDVSDRSLGFGDRAVATVRVTASHGSASGRVEIRADDALLATGDVVAVGRRGTVRLELPRDLPVGAHHLRAVFVGTDDVAPAASGSVSVRVTASTPAVSLGAQSWTVRRGATPTVTVTVAGPAGAPAPGGAVAVLVNLRRVDTVDLGPDGTAEVTLPAIHGRSLVSAVYFGDAGYRPALEVRTLTVR